MRTALGAGIGSLLLLLPLAGCSGDDDPAGDSQPPGPDAVAASLAGALQDGDVSDLAFDQGDGTDVQAQFTTAVGDLADLPHTVEVGDVTQDQPPAGSAAETETATATLTWSWMLGAETWTYDVDVDLTRRSDQWLPSWSTEVVQPDLADDEFLDLSSVEGARGRVLGASGAVLVTDRAVQRVGIDKSQITADQVRSSARALARLVDVDIRPYVAQVRAAGPQAFVEAIVFRQGEEPAAVADGLAAVPGARGIAAQQPLAPTREFAAPILGRVGPVTAEMVQQDPDTYRSGDVAGLSGLQARYDERLRGQPTDIVSAVNAVGERRELTRTAPTPGADLTLTLDEGLQTQAESLLADVGPGSAIVALRPSTGDVLAAANGPGNGGQNLATFGQYAPGSTFKIASTLALLRSGLGPNSRVPCTPTLDVDGRVFGNYSDYPAGGLGDIPLRTALANSCNTAFLSQADRVPEADLASAAAALGLGVDHEVGFPAFFGSLEPAASETQAAADLIGQGTVLASPMAMAAVIASVEQGATVIPRLVVDPAPADTASAPDVPLTADEADTLRTMLRGVVTDGSAAALADVPGEPVIAKTGTAEFGTADAGGQGDLQTHAWMVAAQGDLAVAVFVDVGSGGAATAGPIVEAFLRAAAG